MQKQVHAMYFSPTGTTERTVTAVADCLSQALNAAPALRFNFTLPGIRSQAKSFQASDLVVFGVPVYAGRVPNVLLKYLRTVEGGGALAVPVVSFGNRNYDDALVELCDLLEEQGFLTVAAGAFVGEHSFSTVLGAGRPDEQDLQIAQRFAQGILEKLQTLPEAHTPVAVNGQVPYRPYYVPKDRNGVPVNILKDRPKSGDACIDCKLCARVCPMGSIPEDNVKDFTGICIKCGACVKKCPVHARYYDSHNYLYHKEELELGFARRAEPELFF